MCTETHGSRLPATIGYCRRKALLDLNVPPVDTREQEGTSSQAGAPQGEGGASRVHRQPEPPQTIDVEAIDDDVIVSSPRSFAEAKHNAQRTRGRPAVVDLDSETTTSLTQSNCNKRQRFSSNQTIINCDLYINSDGTGSSNSERDNIQPQLPLSPPKEPTFHCPICMSPFVEETSTRCGHIFCKACIKAALAVRAKCPTCRKRVVAKQLIRVFLPANS